MEELTHLMQLIDAHSERLPEGVYLDLCNSIKSVHDELVDFTPEILELDMNISETDANNYEDLEKSLHTHVMAMENVMKDMEKLKPRKRLSNKLKTEAIKCFAIETGLHSLREYTEEAIRENTNVDVKAIYKWYLDEYNRNIGYRRMACENALHDLRDERDYVMCEMVNNTLMS
jgi:hypothetical protein